MSNPPFGTALDTHAGQGFSYAAWAPNTRVSFHNVPWNSDYRDIVHFETNQELDRYLDTVQGPVFDMMTYAKVNDPVRVNLPFNMCFKYNYLRVFNPAEPTGSAQDEPRVFYYFVRDVTFLAPDTTQLVVQLDVWQTFSRYLTFGNCYIERGHIGIANEHAFDDHGREYLTIPEGFDVGNEYITQFALEHTLADTDSCNVMVASTVVLNQLPGTVTDPNLATSTGSGFEGLPNGMCLYLFNTVDDFKSAMSGLSQYPWLSQGITSITLVPDVYESITASTTRIPKLESGGTDNCKELVGNHKVPGYDITSPNFRDNISLPDRYNRLLKFRTYPYSVIEMTTYHGAPIILKPECVATDALTCRIAMHLAPPAPRILTYPLKYNAKGYGSDEEAFEDMKNEEGYTAVNDRSEFLDLTTGIFDLPMFSIANNGYLSYMASNAHRIAYAYQNADWTQQRAMAGVQLGYNQGTSSLNMMGQVAGAQMGAMGQQRDLAAIIAQGRAIKDIGLGAVGGIAQVGMGNAMGAGNAVMGIADSSMSAALNLTQINEGASINMQQLATTATAQMHNAAYQRDTNQEYGNFAAHGDYANEIAGINARVQDAKLIQPTTSGQLGGEAFMLATFKWGVFWKYKTLQPAVMRSIGEFWLRYGYSVNKFGRMPASFGVMENFTYWKLRETYIASSACPESYKQAVRGIFEKGVTVWSNPYKIGTIDIADNQPLPGVTL